MTKENKDLMYALSKIIALLEKNNKPQPICGIPYDDVVKKANELMENETERIFRDLTGVPLKEEGNGNK